jgi:hypothetical protein
MPCLFAGVLRSSWTALTNYTKRMYEGETSHEIVDAHRAVFGSASKLVLLDERASLHPSIWQHQDTPCHGPRRRYSTVLPVLET